MPKPEAEKRKVSTESNDRASVFVKELFRGIVLENYRAEVLLDKNSSNRAKATTAKKHFS